MDKKLFGIGLLCTILLFFSMHVFAQAPVGEVYVLNTLDVNPVYKGHVIFADVEVEYLQRGNPAYPAVGFGIVTLSVMEEDGNPVPGINFSPTNADFSSADVVLLQFALEGPGVGDYFKVGKTYVVVAEIEPYTTGGNSLSNEIVTGNNRARKTFTVINPPVTFSIPDMPFAFSALVFSAVLGWLFTMRARTKIHSKKTLSKK